MLTVTHIAGIHRLDEEDALPQHTVAENASA